MAPPWFMEEPDLTSAEALSMSGFAAYREGRYGQAAEQLVQAFALKESQPNLLRQAAETYLLAGNHKAAIATQKAAQALLPKNKRVRLRLWMTQVPIRAVLFWNGLHKKKYYSFINHTHKIGIVAFSRYYSREIKDDKKYFCWQ